MNFTTIKCYPALTVIVMLLSVRSALGAWQQFMPKFVGYQGDLTLDGRYLRHDITEESRNTRESDKTNKFKESLAVRSLGYVYNPNLFIFDMSLSGVLYDEKYWHKSDDNENQTSTSAWGDEFRIKGLVLRTKPYNLDFEISKERPFDTGGYVNDESTQDIFRAQTNLNYRKKSISGRLGYFYYASRRDDTSGQSNAVNNLDSSHTFSLNSSFNKKDYSLRLAMARTLQINVVESSRLTNGGSVLTGDNNSVQDRLSTSGSVVYKNFNFLTSANYSTSRREEDVISGESLSSDRSSNKGVRETIDIDLPWRMSGKINMSANRRDNSRRVIDQSLDWSSNYDEDQNVSGVLHHSLFDSLQTELSAAFQNNNTDTSSRSTQNYRLGARYGKKLRRGHLSANVSNGLIIRAENGTSSYTNVVGKNVNSVPVSYQISTRDRAESDSVSVESCDLDSSNTSIDGQQYSCDCYEQHACSISIDEELWTQLNKGSDWNVQQGDTFLNVTLLNLPLGVGPYNIRVSYSLPEAHYTTSSNTSSFSANLSLLDNALSSSVLHSITKEKYLEGDSGFGDLSAAVTRNYLDVLWHKGTIDIMTSYDLLDGENFDDKRWLARGGYHSGYKINRYVKAGWGAKLSREDVRGRDATSESRHNVKRILNTNISFFGPVPFTSMHYRANSSYSRRRGDAPEYRFNENGLWQNIENLEDDTNSFNTGLNINGVVPRIGFHFSLRWSYQLQENLENNINTKNNNYLVSTKKSWVFGGTTVSLDGHYSLLDQRGEVGSNDVDTHKREEELGVDLKIVRVLF